MLYRPLTDLWILARPKVADHGVYPAGFLSRARALLGVSPTDPVLHVCAGMVRVYPYSGVGPNDVTVDGRADLPPGMVDLVLDLSTDALPTGFAAILADPPYTDTDAQAYQDASGAVRACPSATGLMATCLAAVDVGRRVGMLHYEWPGCPPWAKEIAVVGVTTGRRQRMRTYTVMERVQ